MRARGADYFVMFLAYSLGMTRRCLLQNLDSYELTMWSAFLEEMNTSRTKKQTPAEIEANLKTAFMVKSKGKNRA